MYGKCFHPRSLKLLVFKRINPQLSIRLTDPERLPPPQPTGSAARVWLDFLVLLDSFASEHLLALSICSDFHSVGFIPTFSVQLFERTDGGHKRFEQFVP